jgi:hypothetical protein
MVTHHPSLTAKKWAAMGYSRQVLNTAAELGRALKAIESGDSATAQKSIERALELLDLTLEAQREAGSLPELARSREVLAGFYADASPSRAGEFRSFLRVFLGLEKSAAMIKDSYR